MAPGAAVNPAGVACISEIGDSGSSAIAHSRKAAVRAVEETET
jgi:hypothetical protein